jgi:hypothetical protein
MLNLLILIKYFFLAVVSTDVSKLILINGNLNIQIVRSCKLNVKRIVTWDCTFRVSTLVQLNPGFKFDLYAAAYFSVSFHVLPDH